MRSHKRLTLVTLATLFVLVNLYIIIKSRRSYLNIEQSEAGKQPGKQSAKNPSDQYWRTKFEETSLKTTHQLRNLKDGNLSFEYAIGEPSKESIIFKDGEFKDCRMSNCFAFSRCRAEGPIKVGIISSYSDSAGKVNSTLGESNQIHKKILKIIRESDHFEPDPMKACLFILEDDTLDRDPLSQSFQSDLSNIFGPHNDYGLNHLIFNLYSGSWPDYRENNFAGLNFGAAILAKASNSIAYHRPGFDISLPLFSMLHPYSDLERESISESSVENRSYFLTFKGKRYVFGSGSETRNNLYHLNNQRDVIMLTTCRHGKKWRESSDARCLEDEANYDQYDFNDLMRDSTFCLIPRGRRLGSFRYLEAMSFGCIPVILSDGYVKPFDDIIDWSCAAIQFSEDLLLQVPDMLRDISVETITEMRKNCFSLYRRYFSTIERIILTTLSIIERRIKNELNRF